MKKLVIAVLLVTSSVTGAFAKGPAKVNYQVEKSFNSDFRNASNVSWSTTEKYVKATFIVDNQKMEAFYNTEGEKIASSKEISLEELPVKAKRNFAKKYAGYNVKEAIEFEGAEEEAYFISAENETESVIVKVYNDGQVSVFKKSKK